MTPQNNLDLKGNVQNNPVAELLVEIAQARFDGSLRLSCAKKKSVVYFRKGSVVYAVSNAREQRLFSVLLNRKKIDEKTLARFPNLANDLELGTELVRKNIFTKVELDDLIALQIESIIVDALTWGMGEWVFSPLTRVRDEMVYRTDVHKVLIDYARCLPSQEVYQRFRSVKEAFFRETSRSSSALLQSHEQYALDQFNGTPLTIEEMRPLCSLPETAMLQSLYVLWLGGLLVRREWNAAFSPKKVDEIRGAKVTLLKSADVTPGQEKEAESQPKPDPEVEASEPSKLPEVSISLEEYLERVEKAETLYDILGIPSNASAIDVKNAYFSMAKLFHPDRYHREEARTLRRIQVAFTQVAHANETLKVQESRENYDFKMRKELENREKRRAAGQVDASPEAKQTEHGLDSFEKAMEAINEDEFAAAAGHLARAVHYSPQNALYHAYFGYALSQLDKQHHKAEASLQQAVKLDPKNPKIRMMLVEFFVDMKMTKRAIGELNRFLELVPGNKEATKMLADLEV